MAPAGPDQPATTEALASVLGASGNKQLPPPSRIRAILLDVDGTLVNSDPLHFLAFRDMLQEVGFNGGVPIDEKFFREHISGGHNPDIMRKLFPDWSTERQEQFSIDKEALFRRMAVEKLEPMPGLKRLCAWAEARGLRRAAVTNAPRANAEQLIAAVGLTDFFELLVIGSECARAKPFPDPYQAALDHFGVTADEAFAAEDSPSGMCAAVAAGLAVVGVASGQEPPVLEAAGAAFVVLDFEDPRLWEALSEPST